MQLMRLSGILLSTAGLVLAAVVAPPSAWAAAPALELPFKCGTSWLGNSGDSSAHRNNEIDFNLSSGEDDRGEPVLAAAAGTIRWEGDAESAYGNYLEIDHGDGYSTLYAHLDSKFASNGDTVARGRVIGTVGSTDGNTPGLSPHLHFEFRNRGSGQPYPDYIRPASFHGDPFDYEAGEEVYVSQNCESQPAPSRGTVWDRSRSGAGTWDANARLIDKSGWVTGTSAAALPDGTLHVQVVVPGSGVWTRARSAAGVWQTSATRIDTNGSITAVSSAALPDGTLHVQVVVPGSGVWNRTRNAAGTWDGSAKLVDTNGSITDVASAGLPDRTIHLQVLVPGSGIWNRIRAVAGSWETGARRVDANGSITDISSAALPNGTVHLDAVVPDSGVWHRSRSAAGTWDAGARQIDQNGALLDIYTAGLPNGTLHVGVLAKS